MYMKAKMITTISILAAMTAVLTFFPHVPIPGIQGYIHFGDSIIYLTAFSLGGIPAALVGSIGGVIADLMVAPIYALPTCLIKFLMGACAGYVFSKTNKKLLTFLAGTIIMVCGYYIAEIFITGSFITPLTSVPFNLAQAIGSIPIPYLLTSTMDRLAKNIRN